MKKLVYAVITTVIVATTMVNVSANQLPAPVFENRVVDTDNPTTEVPVFGYIGPDAEILDPENPNDPLVVNPLVTDMSVSVPVRLVWAAFASDGGEITSPEYTITNNSPFAVDVELTSFENTTPAGNQNAEADANIVISLTDLNPLATNVVGMTTPLPIQTLSAENGSTKFKIGGTYTGSFATAYQPTYRMVLTFSIH
jgi:hypothetical protein